MIQYPIRFSADAETKSGIQTQWSIRSSETAAPCCVPVEFEGPGGGFSPEDLFAQALTNCFVATFKVYAEKSALTFGDLKVHSELVVDLGEDRKPIMKSIHMRIELQLAANPAKAQMLVERAFKSGFILNSVHTERTYELRFT